MYIEVPISGIVKEACRLVDSTDDSDVIGATASVLHNVLVAGEPSASHNTSDYNFKAQERAWKQLLLYLHELDDARRRLDASTVTDSVRASFFWLYFEPWAAMLLPAASCRLPQTQQQRTGPGTRLPLLLAALMQLAPAPVLLQSLVSHLSLVTPVDASSSEIGPLKVETGPRRGRMSSGASARVTSRGAELAAAFLAQRFATNTGVPELLLHLAADAALIRESSRQQIPREGNASAQRSWHNQTPHHHQQHQQLEEAGVRSRIHADPDPYPNLKPPADRTQACGSGIAMSKADEAVLRHLLLLPPAVAPHQHSSRPSSSKAAAASMYGLQDPALLATLLVSVPDRVAGLSAAGSIATTLPGSPDCLSWLQPEAFYWRLLQQLLAVIGDPGYNVVAALQRLRCSLDEGTAPLTLAEAGVAHCRGVASTETASGDGTDDNSTDANGDANSGADGGSGGDAGVSAAGVTSLEPFVTSAAVELMAEVLARLAKRGHAATAADALLACTSGLGPAYETDEKHYGGSGDRQRLQEGCSAALLQLADADSAALERLLTALLDRGAAAALALTAAWASAAEGHNADEVAPATGGRENEGRRQAEKSAASWQSALHLQQLKQLHQREVTLGFSPPLSPAALAAALSALSWLVPPHVAAHPAVSYILSDRMLLSLQRQPLPLDSLQLLLALLPAAYPGAQPTAAATMLAAAWGDVAAVSRTSVQRQAYLTQALLLVLARLDRVTVEGTPGLLGGLLGGVSQRLGSPLLVTQRQAMRVGRAFSLVLDPASDLFVDMGDLGLALEELWPVALPREVQWRPASGPRTGSQLPRAPGFTSAAVGEARGAKAAADVAETVLADTHGAVGEGVGRDARNEPSCGADGAVEDGEGRGDSGSVCTATDSDDEDTVEGGDADEDADDDGELRPLGSVEEMEGDPEAEAWRRAEPSSLQLRALAAALRKQDDVKGVFAALKYLEEIVRAAPDELGLMAPELVRSLLHCRVPEWAEEGSEGREGSSGRGPGAASSSALDQRRNCLVALLAVAPFPAGDALLPEVYSPHLDLHQRLTLLDSLTAAAAELADPRIAPRLTQGPGGRPVLQRPDLSQLPAAQHRHQLSSGTQTPAASSRSGKGNERAKGCEASDGVQGGGSAVLSQPGVLRRGPRTRVWAPAALRKRKEQEAAAAAGTQAGGSVTFRNRFADVALRWAAGLLREVDRVKHGVDLLGRDHQLLGRLLTTLAAFAEAAAGSAALPPLASATLELIRWRFGGAAGVGVCLVSHRGGRRCGPVLPDDGAGVCQPAGRLGLPLFGLDTGRCQCCSALGADVAHPGPGAYSALAGGVADAVSDRRWPWRLGRVGVGSGGAGAGCKCVVASWWAISGL
ncbi:hypothetical protein Vretifemale_14985 [Volvox reticuliferus]|uniref:Telomere length regulation protein conserved domain-containing protein n=1 Tax=Volvox reticuliferus TaxID=1737510 RepID=A0A8J4CQX6_9CHLO|nr:hypothetical protein Vretifemale_14985 [Volvox reticuliferus]